MNNKELYKMKKIRNYIMLLALALVAVCCSEEDIVTPNNSAKSGDEVQFNLSLNSASRTVYGEEGTSAFPIYWVDGDKVLIFSPHASEDGISAEYKVTAKNTTQNYADELAKTGATGVRWGEGYTYTDTDGKEHTGVHDFYSIYPSGNSTFDSENMLVSGVEVKTSQEISYVNGTFVHDMSNCLMYASTPKVDMEDGSVSLNYNPISTVLWFEVKADEQSTTQEGLKKNFTITGIALEEVNKKPIAGTCKLNANDGTFNSWVGRYPSIAVNLWDKSGTQDVAYTVNAGKTLKFPIFLAPDANIDIRNLKITINTNNGTFVKTLDYDDVDNTTETNTTVAGKIHKIKLPNLAPTAEGWDISTWMKYIPRNVYLSEVSIPGTWNSLNVDCQSNTTIASQYALGVRAFHLDTRWKSDNNPFVGSSFSVINTPTITTLSVATGGSGNTNKYDGANVMKKDASSFKTYLEQITGCVAKDEYMVVFCTFAQNSYNGDLCPSTWYKAISDACADNDKVYDASGLTANTLVGDVLGSVIVVVNLDATVGSSTTTLPESSKCLFTYVPMNLPSDHYSETKATAAGHVDALYYSTKASAGISMYTSHAQISTTGTSAVDCGDRGYSHPLANRDALVNSIWDWSKSNYGTPNYAHDKWIYLGLGGYIMTSSSSSGSGYDTVENRYAPMVYDRIEAMGQNNVPYYPVGIILMNNKKGSNYTNSSGTNLGYGFSDVCKEILLLNNKYSLQYDPTKPADYDPNKKNEGDYDGTGGEGGEIEL